VDRFSVDLLLKIIKHFVSSVPIIMRKHLNDFCLHCIQEHVEAELDYIYIYIERERERHTYTLNFEL